MQEEQKRKEAESEERERERLRKEQERMAEQFAAEQAKEKAAKGKNDASADAVAAAWNQAKHESIKTKRRSGATGEDAGVVNCKQGCVWVLCKGHTTMQSFMFIIGQLPGSAHLSYATHVMYMIQLAL